MSQRHSIVRGDHIEYSMWLVFDAQGSVRMTRAEPNIERGERKLALTAKLPKALFAVPELRATLSVDTDAVKAPVIDIAAIQEALRGVIGLDIDLTVTSQEQPS